MKKKFLSLMLSAALVLSMAACGNAEPASDASSSSAASQSENAPASAENTSSTESTSSEEGTSDSEVVGRQTEVPAEPVVIRYGSHATGGLDPYKVDPVTGEYTMAEKFRQPALAALDAIKEAYNVEFEYVQYSLNAKEELLTSVLAGNPVCDIAILYGGSEATVLSQNVLQKLDDYTYLFEDPEAELFLGDKLFGHYYLLDTDMVYLPYSPLVVNLTMLEAVDALKDENGETIYPMDYFKEGNWTWSVFKDYLAKINAHYKNIEPKEDGTLYQYVQAYETDTRWATRSAMMANGGGLYKDGALAADSQESIEAAAYMQELLDQKLMVPAGLSFDDWTQDDNGYLPRWGQQIGDFQKGGTVFAEIPGWTIVDCANMLVAREESLGIMPWPRPDDLAFDDPAYKQVDDIGDCVGILKGIDEERTELALKAFILYWQTYYKALGNVDSVLDYKSTNAVEELGNLHVDHFNEEYGQDLIDCFTYIGNNMGASYANLLGLATNDRWAMILGKSQYHRDGFGTYDVAIKANMSLLTNALADMEANLASDEIHDNQPPRVAATEDVLAAGGVVLAAGTDAASVDWKAYFTAIDGNTELDMSKAAITVSEGLKLATAGKYDNSVELVISDEAGNEGKGRISVIVYNSENKTAPTVAAKAELPAVVLNTDTATINWKDYLESAVDADGLDVKNNVKADLSELDTTTPGTYKVVLTVTDYAGNASNIEVQVTVNAAE